MFYSLNSLSSALHLEMRPSLVSTVKFIMYKWVNKASLDLKIKIKIKNYSDLLNQDNVDPNRCLCFWSLALVQPVGRRTFPKALLFKVGSTGQGPAPELVVQNVHFNKTPGAHDSLGSAVKHESDHSFPQLSNLQRLPLPQKQSLTLNDCNDPTAIDLPTWHPNSPPGIPLHSSPTEASWHPCTALCAFA